MKTIGITGGTGLVGSHIIPLLTAMNYQVVVLTRTPRPSLANSSVSYAQFDYAHGKYDASALAPLDAVIHLAGESIAAKRWTAKQKQKIASSRIDGTRFLVQALQQHAPLCKTFVAASAIGFYGEDAIPPVPFTETAPPSTGFLSDTCVAWEAEINGANRFARTVIIRSGIVLAKNGGALPQLIMAAPFRLLPIPGHGRQILSWIHIADIAALYIYALERENMSGIYNAVAPNPESYNTFVNTIAAVNGGFFFKPHIPAPLLKALLGEMSIELLKSATVVPQRTLASGFSFSYPSCNSALQQLLP